jgi:hypothetical protein
LEKIIFENFNISENNIISVELAKVLRASPMVLSMGLQTGKLLAKKSKCARLAQEIGFSAPYACNLS